MDMVTFGSLFSGIGGFDLGFERVGMRCVWQCEIDKAARSVLARHWPDVPCVEDVRDVTRDNVPAVDVVCGGFPCQDVSVAGKRAGLAGERSGLWFEFYRVIAELKPRWVVVENVPGLLSSNGGADFATVISGLVECGYGVSWRILDSQYFGVAQRRRRVFIVGSLGDGRSAEVLFEREGMFGDPPARRAQGQGVAGTLGNRIGRSHTEIDGHGDIGPVTVFEPRFARNGRGAPDTIAPPLKAQNGGTGKGDGAPVVAFTERTRTDGRNLEWQNDVSYALDNPGDGGRTQTRMIAFMSNRDGAPVVAFDWQSGGDVRHNVSEKHTSALQSNQVPAFAGTFGVRRLTPVECERLQSFPDNWTAIGSTAAVYSEPNTLGGEAEIIGWKDVPQSDSARYRQLGNAVTVSVAEWIGRRIVEVNGHD